LRPAPSGHRYKKYHWDERHILKSYELARSGLVDIQIARALGVTLHRFLVWRKEHPGLDEALRKARRTDKMGVHALTLKEFIFGRLDPRLQRLWSEINECEETTNDIRRIESMLEDAGKKARQHLFLYALFHSNFMVSEACRKVGVKSTEVKHWGDEDPDFLALVREINTIKGDFFEGALIDLVRKGDGAATIFANRTFNKGRGYDSRVELNVKGKVDHAHAHAHLTLEDLPLDLKRQVLEAIREKNGTQHPLAISHQEDNIQHLDNKAKSAAEVIDAEFTS